MTDIGFQLYSLHEVSASLPDVLARVGDTPFAGVEFAGLGDAAVGDVAAALDDAGLVAAGAHVPLDDVEADPGDVAETYRALGCSEVVVPWLDPEHFADLETTRATAARLEDAAARLADHDVTLHYHNHDQEFAVVDGRPVLDVLAAETDRVRFELDLGWAGAAGHDPLSVLEALADRISLVHLKDFDAADGAPVEVGAGDLDVGAAVSQVRNQGVDWLVYEAEARPDSFDTLTHAADVVASHW